MRRGIRATILAFAAGWASPGAAAADDWQQLYPWPVAEALHAVAEGNGRWVAAGVATARSDDGVSWQLVPGVRALNSVLWDGAQFVAVGSSSEIATSPDGRSWSWHQVTDQWTLLEDLAWDGARWVVVGTDSFWNGRIFFSDDLTTWYEAAASVAGRFSAVAWGEGHWVAVGATPDAFLTSSDGEHWFAVPAPDDGQTFRNPSDVAWCGDRFVTLGLPGHATSPDGTSWSSRLLPPLPGYPTAVACEGDQIAYLGLTHDDGWAAIRIAPETWTTIAIDGRRPRAAVWRNGRWTLVGDGGLILRADGAGRTVRLDSGTLGTVNAATADGMLVVAVGGSGGERIWTSRDGIAWRTVFEGSLASTELRFVSWTGDRFLSGGYFGNSPGSRSGLLVSSDGIGWRRPAAGVPTASFFLDGTGVGDTLVVLALRQEPTRVVPMVSDHGDAFTETPLGAAGVPAAITWTGSHFVVVGSEGLVASSPDGMVWAARSLAGGSNLVDVASGGGLVVAVASTGGAAVSSNLVDWQWNVVPGAPILDEVEWLGDRFITRSIEHRDNPDRLLESTDGRTWRAVPGPDPYHVFELCPAQDGLLAFTSQARVFRRPGRNPEGGGHDLYALPVAIDAAGAGDTHWQSTLSLLSPGRVVNRLWLAGSPLGSSLPEWRQLQLAPGAQLDRRDLLDELFPRHTGALPLVVAAVAPVTGWSRFFTASAAGSHGQRIPVIPRLEARHGSAELILPLLAGGPAFRSNLGISNFADGPLDLHVEVLARDASSLGTLELAVPAGAWTQVNRLLKRLGAGTTEHAWARIASNDPQALYFPYVSVVDELSGDPTLIVAERPTGQPLVIPAVAHNPGEADTLWRSDLVIVNPGDTPADVRLELLAGSPPASRELTVPPHGQLLLADVLFATFGRVGRAALRVVPLSEAFVATSRLYTVSGTGSRGQLVPAIAESTAIPESGAAYVVGLEQSPDLRSNLGLVNPTPHDIAVSLKLHHGDGMEIATLELVVPAHSLLQDNTPLARLWPHPATGYAVVRPTAPGLLAWASIVDQRSGDPVFVPAVTVHD